MLGASRKCLGIVLAASWVVSAASWRALGASGGHLGDVSERLETFRCVSSWRLGASEDVLGSLGNVSGWSGTVVLSLVLRGSSPRW